MNNERFWETKKLSDLTRDEWEALCDGCAKCCIQRKKTGEAIPPKNLGSLCYLLDTEPCRCSAYEVRQQLEPKCVELSANRPEQFELMPETCAYRLLHEGKPLPDWHPLVTGNPDSALQHKIVVNGKLNLEPTAPASAPASTSAPVPSPNPAPTPASTPEPVPTIQVMEENTLQMEKKTSQMAEDAKKILYSTLKTVEKTSLTGKFLSTTSHEIRTALNGIVGMAQLISDTQLTYEQRSCIDTILQSTTGLLKTINYVLDISKLESGQMDICETTVDLRSICDRLYSMFHPLAEQKGLSLKCECQRNVPLSVICDEDLLERVLSNLLRNALKHTHKGSVILNIESHEKSQKGARILFHVIDTGDGINKEQQAAILEKPSQGGDGSFQQLHQRTSMDMAVSKQLIELMGGELDLVSTKDKGSTFSIALVLRQANNPASINFNRVKTITKPNAKVLLAEDNKVNQKVVISILRKAGCEVDAVDNGKDAVRKIQENRYDMVLMDCQMPVLDGFEATAQIRNMDAPACKTPIVALTAHAMKADKQNCIDSGMDGYLPKPVGRQELIDSVNKYAV